MRTPRSVGGSLRPGAQALLALFLLGILLITSACGGDAQTQQNASHNQTQLDLLLQHAQSIGVPASALQPILKQKQQLETTQAPFSLFNESAATDYYRNIGTRYEQLTVQTQGIINSTTQQDQTQAQQALNAFGQLLSQLHSQGLPVQYFTQQYNQVQVLATGAVYPNDYTTILSRSQNALQTLDMMKTTNGQLQTFKNTIDQMQSAHLDITALQMQYQNDWQQLGVSTAVPDFQKLDTLVNAQYIQAAVNTNQALPYITNAKLNDLATKFKLLKDNGVDVTTYQQQFDADKTAAKNIKNVQNYIQFSKQVDADIALMHDDLITAQAKSLLQQFHKEADDWSNAHLYHNKYDSQTYSQGAGYQQAGIGWYLDQYISWAYTPDDYQSIIDQTRDELFTLHMMEANYNDKTPYNQVHAADMKLLDYYKVMKGQVIVVSMYNEALRLYQDGKLVKSFLVTTGRAERPTLPGLWNVQERQSPTVFKSSDPPGSPYYYPDTPIHYALLYHHGGYFIHDSWWRADYGPGTQYPHVDSGGDASFSNNGSHGCVNVQEDEAAWLYNNTDYNTQVIIY